MADASEHPPKRRGPLLPIVVVLVAAAIFAATYVVVRGDGDEHPQSNAAKATSRTAASKVPSSGDALGDADAASVSRPTQRERTAATVAGVRIDRDITFTTPADPAPLQLDVYRPSTKPGAVAQALPIVVVVHGGGWRTGKKEDVIVESLRLARSGFVVVAPNYRLSCGSSHAVNPGCGWHHPAPVNDIGEVLRWVQVNGTTYTGDPTRIGLLGFSAGGQLAEMAAYGADRTAPRVGAVVAWSAPLPRLLGTSTRRLTDYQYVGCSFRRCPQKWLAASPDTWVSPDDPPTRIVESANEIVPSLHGRELTRVLHVAQVPVEFQVYPGHRHATQYELTEWAPTLRFLHEHLAHPPATVVDKTSHVVPDVFAQAGD